MATTTIIEITAHGSENEDYHVTGKHLHQLQVVMCGWLADDNGNRTYWVENLAASIDLDTAVVYATSPDGSYLIDEKATTANLQMAFPGAEIRWTTADEPCDHAALVNPPHPIALCISRECDGPNCILVGGRPATARLRRRADHAWHRAGKGETLAERYAEKLQHDRILARADALDPTDDSLDARQVRGVAASIRDHRAMAARRAQWALEDARA
jgi:hypothetical protein